MTVEAILSEYSYRENLFERTQGKIFFNSVNSVETLFEREFQLKESLCSLWLILTIFLIKIGGIIMIVTTVTVYVQPEHVDDFIESSEKNHEGSIREPGNMRFDVLQCTNDPTRFLLYEAYESEETSAAHKSTEHYLKWRDTVADWMAKPRQGVPYKVITPVDRNKW